jgi:hypothetical protein
VEGVSRVATSNPSHWFSAGQLLLAIVLCLLDLKGAGIGFGALAFVFETFSQAIDIGAGREDDEDLDPRG